MNELLKVNADNQTVSARDLHDALEATERFSVWIQRYLPNFIAGEDFTSVSKLTVVNNGAERELEDYELTIDTAKHICLMSRTEKGKQCRQYLIDLEKAWNTPEQVFARALKMADVAKVLNYGKGRNTLFKILRKEKILMKDNRPYQEYVDRGFFRVVEQKFDKGYGEVGINIKTLVFQKGVDYIRRILEKNGYYDE